MLYDNRIAPEADEKILTRIRHGYYESDSDEDENQFEERKKANTEKRLRERFWTASNLICYRIYALGMLSYIRDMWGMSAGPMVSGEHKMFADQIIGLCRRIAAIEEYAATKRQQSIDIGEAALEKFAQENEKRRKISLERLAKGPQAT